MTSQNDEQDLTPIGSLMKNVVNMLGSVDTTRTNSPSNLPTTIEQKGLQCWTGTRRGVPGLVMPTVSEAVKTGDPATVDKTMAALLPQSVTTSIEYVTDRDYNTTGVTLTTSVSEQDRERAVSMFEAICRPARPEKIIMALGKLRIKTAAKDGDDLEARIAVYAEELGEYPADIVLDALNRWPKMSRWFPTWHELMDIIEWRANKRKWTLEALRGF